MQIRGEELHDASGICSRLVQRDRTKICPPATRASGLVHCRSASVASNTTYLLLLLPGEVWGAVSAPTDTAPVHIGYRSSSGHTAAHQALKASLNPPTLLLLPTCYGSQFHSSVPLLVKSLALIWSPVWLRGSLKLCPLLSLPGINTNSSSRFIPETLFTILIVPIKLQHVHRHLWGKSQCRGVFRHGICILGQQSSWWPVLHIF